MARLSRFRSRNWSAVTSFTSLPATWCRPTCVSSRRLQGSICHAGCHAGDPHGGIISGGEVVWIRSRSHRAAARPRLHRLPRHERDLVLRGYLAFLDPPKDSAAEATAGRLLARAGRHRRRLRPGSASAQEVAASPGLDHMRSRRRNSGRGRTCGCRITATMLNTMRWLRFLTLSLFVAHLMIRAVAVPHAHAAAHGQPGPDHGHRPHIHLGGHGHHHEHEHEHAQHAQHAHGLHGSAPARNNGDHVAATSPGCCHDDDAIDVSMSALAGSPGWRRAWTEADSDTLLSLPALATVVSPAPHGHRGLSCRPPGDAGGTIPHRFPHVLRI